MSEAVQLPSLTLADLSQAIAKSRTRFKVDEDIDLNRYVKLWREDESWQGTKHRAMTLILRTRGCTWDYQHGCTMCGYFVDTAHRKVNADQLVAQWRAAAAEHKGESILKIYTGGNFLDPAEVMDDARRTIVAEASRLFKLVIVESRPEYCTPARLREVEDACRANGSHFMVALGLESSSDEVCDKAINKGYGFRHFVEAAKACREAGVGVKTYLLLKPPFLTEEETVEDIVRSIADCAPHSDIISVNPTNVQKFTLVETLWKDREYRSPWLWSVLEVLRRGKPAAASAVLKSDPVGGGSKRGAHNCGRCDEEVLGHIESYNTTQDIAFVEAAGAVECSCKPLYRAVRRLEGFMTGSAWVD
ncbi:MAG: archaeosine biosynthesis radical SAM protein RaSEA [Euryarchaeota archaeon]|nr:archaeosine biosynthesis radical SAM protein RaSEA [Euryarchaeota archaeon]